MSDQRLLRVWARLCAVLVLLSMLAGCAALSATTEPSRIAVISAFAPELALLQTKVERPVRQTINGVEFTTGTLQGKPVVLFQSGISMTNAAMNTQLALDRFKVSHILVSGIAGGVNPGLHVGDVTVAERWGPTPALCHSQLGTRSHCAAVGGTTRPAGVDVPAGGAGVP